MAIIPSDTRFIGISPGVNLVEKKSTQLNSETQPYTMQDIIDTAGGGGAGLQLKDGATITSTLQVVADSANTSTALRVSTKDVSNFGNSGDETNTAFGVRALNASTNGFNQVAIGMNALQNHSASWSQNVAIGANALRNATDEQTVAIGLNAGINYVDYFSTFVGTEAAAGGQYGIYRTAIGWKAGYSNTTGESVAIGAGAMQNMTGSTGDSCIALGSWAMQDGNGNYNMALGYQAGRFMGSSDNIAIGYNASYGGGTGGQNVSIGTYAFFGATTGAHNVFVGHNAGRYTSSGSSNVFIGSGSGPAIGGNTYSSTLCIGRNAYATASNQVVIGSSAYPFSAVTAGAQTQTHYWTVKINGTDYKILLAS